MHTLFYSTRCEHCKTLVEIIKANELQPQFRPICVEKSPVPREVTTVPTIITEDLRVRTGIQAFDFVKFLTEENDVRAYELGSANDTVFSYVDGNGEMERTMKYMYMEEEQPFHETQPNEPMDPRLQKLIDARKNDSFIPNPVQRV